MLFLGALVLRNAESYVTYIRRTDAYSKLGWLVLPFSLLSLAVLFFSDGFIPSWQPVLGAPVPFSIPWSVALLVIFIGDALFVSYLVWRTHGSFSSPFSPILFLLPTLGILLRESPKRIVLYVTLIAALFTIILLYPSSNPYTREDREIRGRTLAYWIVSMLSFGLATGIGLLTRPGEHQAVVNSFGQ